MPVQGSYMSSEEHLKDSHWSGRFLCPARNNLGLSGLGLEGLDVADGATSPRLQEN